MSNRRQFLTLLGGTAVAWPLAARAQQPPMPVIGFLAEGTPDSEPDALPAFQQGLREAGYVEGQNVQIDYRWSGAQRDLLLALTADLVRRKVTVIYTARGSAVAQAARRRLPLFRSSSRMVATRSNWASWQVSIIRAVMSPALRFSPTCSRQSD